MVCTPVAVIGPVNTIAPVPAGSTTKSPFESVVIVPSARMFKSPIAVAPFITTAPLNVAVPLAVTAAVVSVPLMSQVPLMSMAVAVR